MRRNSHDRFDVLVVGGGPAGLSAATRAVECGKRVGIVDDNLTLGGQIWRASPPGNPGPVESFEPLRNLLPKIVVLSGKRVFENPEPGVLLAEGADEVSELRYQKLILATGARERFLPFPGWTLPNVMGAGGLQAMVKSGLPIGGKRVVVAGSGPLLLAVAAYLRAHGAEIVFIAEQAGWRALAAFGLQLAGYGNKVREALGLRKKLAGVPFAANSWPVSAEGTDRVQSVVIRRGGTIEELPCDYLACGFHLVPNVELPVLLGCETEGGKVKVGALQETAVPGVFSAGEANGIGGVESALAEGAIAGLAAGGRPPAAGSELFRQRAHARRFARMLEQTFRVRPELKGLPTASTIVCRCEDVTHARLERHSSWRAAKLHTRCGMGPCQGRICGPAVKFLFGWNADSVRPPIFPARVESLAALVDTGAETSAVTGGSK
jgi:D-hydroxyproline dehydrogenase subunit alpha